jgi:chromosome segregation protein
MQGLTRQEAMERRRDGSLKELHDTVGTLKEKIAALGQINPNAEEEYTAAVEQQQFYDKQCSDLQESREKLVGVVAEIDAAMAEQFSQAFKEIAVHFQRIFSRLFGGGSAQITLTDEKDILASGVDIYIQPPGKKQQQLTLLSGGERALTVIALLLAFLAYHPAPFCLVDEVDAALDEANVERMAQYLKNYSGNTQFIVITHRRKTMEAANTLQGVTMEEKGVSRLLTVKVDELIQKGT